MLDLFGMEITVRVRSPKSRERVLRCAYCGKQVYVPQVGMSLLTHWHCPDGRAVCEDCLPSPDYARATLDRHVGATRVHGEACRECANAPD